MIKKLLILNTKFLQIISFIYVFQNFLYLRNDYTYATTSELTLKHTVRRYLKLSEKYKSQVHFENIQICFQSTLIK